VAIEFLHRPRFQKQTQIAQARHTRSQITQIDSACRDYSVSPRGPTFVL